MEGGGSTSFEEFVLRCAPDLLRTAVLLTGNREDAEDLLRSALVAAYRRSGGDRYGVARRELIFAAVGRRRGGTVQRIVDVPDSPVGPVEDDALVAALARLSPGIRAVLVLRFWEGLPAGAAAELLRTSVDSVETDTATGLADLRIGGPEEAAGRLRDHFAARADRVRPPRRDLAEAVVADHRRSRRRRTAVLAAAVAAVLALGGVAVGSRLLELDPSRTEGPVARAEQDLGIYEVPTRGSLAADEAFVEDVRAIDWSAPIGWAGRWVEPGEVDRRVLFAGEVPGGQRWALVMGRVGFQLLYVWLTGPPDAEGSALQPAAPPGRGGPDEPMTLMDSSRPAPTLVVVSLPGDQVAYSADGSSWEPVPTDDGVAVGVVAPPVSLAEAELRITRAGGDVVHRSALAHLRPTGSDVPPGAGPGPAEDPEGRQYGERMRDCLLSVGWVVTAAAGGAAIVAGADLGDRQRLLAFQQDRQQCEVALGYRD